MIGQVCEETNSTTFKEAWKNSIGRGAWVLQLTCILECLGGSVVYAMVLGDMFSSFSQGIHGLPSILCARSTLIVAVAATMLYPLCCLRTFGQLAKFSALGTAASSFVVFFVVKRFFDGTYSPLGAFDTLGKTVVDSRILILASILSTAFLVHFNAPQMYAELRPSTPLHNIREKARKQARFGTVAVLGFGLATVQYALIMVFGFLTFGRTTQGNVLLNYSMSDSWATAAWLAVGVSMLFGYPMQFAGFRSG